MEEAGCWKQKNICGTIIPRERRKRFIGLCRTERHNKQETEGQELGSVNHKMHCFHYTATCVEIQLKVKRKYLDSLIETVRKQVKSLDAPSRSLVYLPSSRWQDTTEEISRHMAYVCLQVKRKQEKSVLFFCCLLKRFWCSLIGSQYNSCMAGITCCFLHFS